MTVPADPGEWDGYYAALNAPLTPSDDLFRLLGVA